MVVYILRGILGIILLLGITWLLSRNRNKISWKLVSGGLLLQFILGLLIFKIGFVYQFFSAISDGFVNLLSYADEGADFLFGDWPSNVYVANGEPLNEVIWYQVGHSFAFKVLPTVIFFSAFSAVLYYFGILQKIIYFFAQLISKFMKLSGAEAMAAAANVFVGQTEAPLVIKPYLEKMSRSEIMSLMVGGFATIAGGVFALFIEMIGADYAIHFLTASIISAPAAIMVAKMLVPVEDDEDIDTEIKISKDKIGNNLLDAISRGTTDGVKLAVNVGAMLLVFIALVAFVNAILGFAGSFGGINEYIVEHTDARFQGLSLEYILGILFSPIAWIIGIPTDDIFLVGQLLGKKMAINEVIAYNDLSMMLDNPQIQLSERSKLISTYALCGFANFASIGIQIGGISSLASNQRKNLTELGLIAMIGGTIAALFTGCIAGIIFSF